MYIFIQGLFSSGYTVNILNVLYKQQYIFISVFIYLNFNCFRTEYDWSDSPGITPYKLVEPGGVRMRLGRTGSTDSDVPSTPTSASTLRVKIE